MNQKQIIQFRYRESGMGQGQTFFWNGATGELRYEEDGREEPKIKRLSSKQQAVLEQRLTQAKVTDWKPVYETEWLILDGESRGSNAFPEEWEVLRDWLYGQCTESGEETR
ncbi:hypothetical protein [Exiguobacterium oxidotolerans]|uniref:hypothetical protein n=1 Tax=Exiguobacterium oxidotolerans TaxID=223958 RepID=UPI001F44BEEB|nr:hypothetical protein [Exiguobacterium oxidotolerans]